MRPPLPRTAGDLAVLQQRADAARRPPYWPFAPLTDDQARGVADQETTLRDRASARTDTAYRRLMAAALVVTLGACATAPEPADPPAPEASPLLQASCPSPLLYAPMDNDWMWRAIYTRCRDAALNPPPRRVRMPRSTS